MALPSHLNPTHIVLHRPPVDRFSSPFSSLWKALRSQRVHHTPDDFALPCDAFRMRLLLFSPSKPLHFSLGHFAFRSRARKSSAFWEIKSFLFWAAAFASGSVRTRHRRALSPRARLAVSSSFSFWLRTWGASKHWSRPIASQSGLPNQWHCRCPSARANYVAVCISSPAFAILIVQSSQTSISSTNRTAPICPFNQYRQSPVSQSPTPWSDVMYGGF